MIVKVIFSSPNNPITIHNQTFVNKYIHKSMGHNEFHDTFSDYSISSLQGGKFIGNEMISFENTIPWIQITSNDMKFINSIIMGIQNTQEELLGMKFLKFEFNDFSVGENYDTIYTISPISLKDKDTDKKITFKDNGWLEKLEYHCFKKLKHKNIIDPTFRIELRHPEKFKVKKIDVGHNSWNIASQVSLKIYGQKTTRYELYNMGIGNSTGSGFGAIKLYND